MEINTHEDCVEVKNDIIITYTRGPKGLRRGPYIETFASTGRLRLVCNYADDLLDGLYTEYYDNGLQKHIGCYRMGKRNGIFTTYDDIGGEIERCEYVDDLLQGVKISRKFGRETITFYVDGLREGEEIIRNWLYDYIYEVNNYKADKLDGCCKEYYENGKLRRKLNYVDGLKEGLEIHYHKSSGDEQTIFETVVWKNNKKNGDHIIYYSHINGVLKKTPYVNDLIEGEVIKYYPNGNVKSTKTHVNGVASGAYKSYHQTGAVSKIRQYENGLKEGEFMYFHTNGVVSVKGVYRNNKYHDKVYRYYSSGVIESIKKYLDGRKNGHQVCYNENGRKSHEYVLYRGKLQNVYTEYHTNGKYSKRTLYEAGERVWEEEYRVNGSMYTYTEFKDKSLHGDVITYYDIDVDKKNIGLIWIKSKYFDGRRVHTIVYNPDGSIKSDTNF